MRRKAANLHDIAPVGLLSFKATQPFTRSCGILLPAESTPFATGVIMCELHLGSKTDQGQEAGLGIYGRGIFSPLRYAHPSLLKDCGSF
jgi:hypothetical protein